MLQLAGRAFRKTARDVTVPLNSQLRIVSSLNSATPTSLEGYQTPDPIPLTFGSQEFVIGPALRFETCNRDIPRVIGGVEALHLVKKNGIHISILSSSSGSSSRIIIARTMRTSAIGMVGWHSIAIFPFIIASCLTVIQISAFVFTVPTRQCPRRVKWALFGADWPHLGFPGDTSVVGIPEKEYNIHEDQNSDYDDPNPNSAKVLQELNYQAERRGLELMPMLFPLKYDDNGVPNRNHNPNGPRTGTDTKFPWHKLDETIDFDDDDDDDAVKDPQAKMEADLEAMLQRRSVDNAGLWPGIVDDLKEYETTPKSLIQRLFEAWKRRTDYWYKPPRRIPDPRLSPTKVVRLVLQALRNINTPTRNRGIEVFLGYLSRKSPLRLSVQHQTPLQYSVFLKKSHLRVLMSLKEMVSPCMGCMHTSTSTII